jgi:hypothetical protein
MLPPRLVRRFVLAPLVVVIAVAVHRAVAAAGRCWRWCSGWPGGAAGPDARPAAAVLRADLARAETAALFMLPGLWIERVRRPAAHRAVSEPPLRGHAMVPGRAVRRGGPDLRLRVEVDEPELTAEERLARLARPVIVLSRHAGPGDSFLLIHSCSASTGGGRGWS